MAFRAQPAFKPVAESTVSLATTSVSDRVALASSATEYLITNDGTATAFFRFGSVTVVATVPSGATGGSTPIAAGTVQVFRPATQNPLPTNIAAITASGSTTLYVAAGEGA